MRIGISGLRLIHSDQLGGYYITGYFTDSSDGMYDEINHPAVFRDEKRADAFLMRVLVGKPDLRNWRGSDSQAAAFQLSDASPGFYSVL